MLDFTRGAKICHRHDPCKALCHVNVFLGLPEKASRLLESITIEDEIVAVVSVPVWMFRSASHRGFREVCPAFVRARAATEEPTFEYAF